MPYGDLAAARAAFDERVVAILWLTGDDAGIRVFDISGGELVELARRSGIECGRMALRESAGPTHVYCVRFRGPGVVSWVPVSL